PIRRPFPADLARPPAGPYDHGLSFLPHNRIQGSDECCENSHLHAFGNAELRQLFADSRTPIVQATSAALQRLMIPHMPELPRRMTAGCCAPRLS
ncbi:MAG TPA: hypothetical protein VFZ81_05645, partial [Burkholderiales bacterium]